jgi:ketosteroid isomerase-like protein
LNLFVLEIEKRLEELDHEQKVLLKAKNLDGLLDFYHPDAVIVHRGNKASYGREGRQQIYN